MVFRPLHHPPSDEPDHMHGPAHPQAVQRPVDCRRSANLNDVVYAFAVRKSQNLLVPVGCGDVVDEVRRAEFFCFREFGGGGGCGDDSGAGGNGELESKAAREEV